MFKEAQEYRKVCEEECAKELEEQQKLIDRAKQTS